ncbi:Endoglucanase 7 [Capsicum annuum]|uniref:cellulase n=1 Tax=Capsicum annuum TaxID=4072 RepID=A0A2G2Y5J3_CAPAN|nr:Endoglucanase 7 [Capsicum annuum]
MQSNHWGGSLEIATTEDDNRSHNLYDSDRASINDYYDHSNRSLDQTQQSWLLGPPEKKKKKYVDLGCIICSKKALKYSFYAMVMLLLVIGLPTIVVKFWPKHKPPPIPQDDYTFALHKALRFFNAQKSGKLPKSNGIPWRGNSGLQDGSTLTDVKGGLVGGYYDAGDNIKFHFPMSFAMTMLSWSVIEYEHKYRAIGEYDNITELIKWGTDYLLRTFNSSATRIDKIYSQQQDPR